MRTKIHPPFIMISFLLIAYVLNRHLPLVHFHIPGGVWLTCGLCGISFVLVIHSAIKFKASNTTVNPIKPDSTSVLVVSGFYRFTRNPMYLGLAIALSASCLYMGSVSSFVCVPLFVVTINYLQIIPEEQALEAKFGNGYLDYKAQVRRWI